MKSAFKKVILVVITMILCISMYGCDGCGRRAKYPDALKIGVSEIPKTLNPYVSTAQVNTYTAGLIYDTLLDNATIPSYTQGEDFVFINGDKYTPIDKDNNYFLFEDRLLETDGAYARKDNSDYGWITFNPNEEEYNAQLKRKNIVFGYDEIGNVIEETQEQFNKRKEEAVPTNNWMEYRFKVRAGYTWNDGVPFTASDIEFTFKYALKNSGALASIAYFLNNYFDCYVEDDGDFVLKLATNKLSDIKTICTSIFIIPQHIWKDIRKPNEEKNMNPIGTGAYKLLDNDYIADSSLTLTYRKEYNDKLKAEMFAYEPIENISFIRLSNSDIMLNALTKGDIDTSLDALENTKAHLIKDDNSDGLKVATRDSEFVTTIVFNVGKKGRFKNGDDNVGYKLRKAISLSIDQQKLIDDVLYSKGNKVGDCLIQDTELHAYKDSDGKYVYHETNVDKAKALLDEAGYPLVNGKRNLNLSIYATPNNESLVKAIATIVNENLNINITYKQADATYAEKIKQNNGADFDMIINSVTFAPDKLLMFDARYGVYPTGGVRVWNSSGVNDELLSSYMREMDLENDIFEQYSKSQIVQSRLAELCVEIPLYSNKIYSAYSTKRFTGWIEASNDIIANSHSIKYIQLVNEK